MDHNKYKEYRIDAADRSKYPIFSIDSRLVTTMAVQPESEEIGRSGWTKLKYSYLQRKTTKSAFSEPRSEGKDNELYQSIKKR